MKRHLVLALAVLVLGGTLSGCGGRSKKLTLRVAAPEESVWQVAAEEFKAKVEERSEGRFKIVLEQGESSVGDSASFPSGMEDLDLRSLSSLREAEKKLAVVSMPWLFADTESVDRVLYNGPGREAVYALIRGLGAEPLGLGENGFSLLTSDSRSLTAPSDFAGLSLRAPRDGTDAELLNAMGAGVTILNDSASFSALKEGSLDGQASFPDNVRRDRSYLVQRYMTLWNCAYDPILLNVSRELWDSLSAEDQNILRTAAEEACADEIQSARTALREALTEFRESGVEVTELTPEQTAAFRAQAEAVYQKWTPSLGGDLLAVFGYAAP